MDEFRTLKLHYKTEGICKNLYLLGCDGKLTKKHSTLTINYKKRTNIWIMI
jgi:hypothetical protein